MIQAPRHRSSARMAGTATHLLRSKRLPQRLRIDVSLPIEYEGTDRRYPVVYLIDGHWFFPIVSHAVRPLELSGELPPFIVVGVGYASEGLSRSGEEERVNLLRFRDLTPTADTSNWYRTVWSGRLDEAGIEPGHAEEFVRLIEREVKPLVHRHYRADSADETLAGFSLGGLFALHVLFRHTHLFHRYVAGSPSLWWGERVMLKIEAEYAEEKRDLKTRLFLSMGALEESGSLASFGMLSNFKVLLETLASRGYSSLNCDSLIFPNETHAMTIAPTFIKGLLAVFSH